MSAKDYIEGYKKGYERGSLDHWWRGWCPAIVPPDSDRKVLCLTKTKKGVLNHILGYYEERWCCGMNSNVIAWMDLPAPPEEEKP